MDKLTFPDGLKVKGEWFLEYEDGTVVGPIGNFITTAGKAAIAGLIAAINSPYLVVGDDVAAGDTITEVFRKEVSAVTQDGAMVRFRTVLLASECNGNHQKAAIFYGAGAGAGTGTMLNLLVSPWSKASNTQLTLESRITVTGV